MSTQDLIASLTKDQLKDPSEIPHMDVGDMINVHCRIIEGEKERIQVFQGTLISRKGGGIEEMITIRRLVDGAGVERTFPLNSPRISKYEVVRRADARRAKLYFLRDRTGKSARLRDRRRKMKHVKGLKTLR